MSPDKQLDRIKKLQDELNEKRETFSALSKENFAVEQNYLSKCSQLKKVKRKVAKETQSYLDDMVEVAKRKADLEYQYEILDEKVAVANDLSSERNEEVNHCREELEKILNTFSECRKNVNCFQSEVSNVTDNSRIEALNLVAFCRYAQSITVSAIAKINPEDLPSKAELTESKTFFAKQVKMSTEEMNGFFFELMGDFQKLEKIYKWRRKEQIERAEKEAGIIRNNDRTSSAPLPKTQQRRDPLCSRGGPRDVADTSKKKPERAVTANCYKGHNRGGKTLFNKDDYALPLLQLQPNPQKQTNNTRPSSVRFGSPSRSPRRNVTEQQEEALLQLFVKVASLEGKYRELQSIKDGLERQLLKQVYLLRLLSNDLHQDLGVTSRSAVKKPSSPSWALSSASWSIPPSTDQHSHSPRAKTIVRHERQASAFVGQEEKIGDYYIDLSEDLMAAQKEFFKREYQTKSLLQTEAKILLKLNHDHAVM